MLRTIFTYVLPLLLPTLMFFVWTAWARRKIMQQHANSGEVTAEEVQEALKIRTPWFRLILAGLGLTVLGLLLSVIMSPKNPPDSIYQAPRLQNGKVIPGGYAPR